LQTDSIYKWYGFDITALVADWVEAGADNHGVVIHGALSWSPGKFYFTSAEDGNANLRPRLVITYVSGEPPPLTPTATRTLPPDQTPTATQPPSPGLRAGPYLGHTTPNTALISWVTDAAVTGKVRFSRDTSYAYEATAVRNIFDGKYWHVATIGSLQADTTYRYRIYNNDVDVTPWPEVTFTTAPGPSGSRFDFVVLGDGRPGTAHAPPSSAAQNLAAEMALHSFDLGLHTGDIVYSGGVCSGSTSGWDQYLRAYLGLYSHSIGRTPFYPAMGNHEVYDGACGYQSYTSVYHLPRNAPGGLEEQFYSFDWGNAHFVSLDCNQSLHRGSLQYQWLLNDLQYNDQPWTFVFLHYPVYSSGYHGSDPLLQEKLPPLFETYGVDVVFSGHDHHYERTCPVFEGACDSESQSAVTYYVTGGAGAPLYPVGSGWFTARSASAYHFLMVAVDGCRLRIDAVEPDGAVFDTFELDRCLSAPVGTP
jgi:hypothetical protein